MRPLLSDARLDRYLAHYLGREGQALRLYTWNHQISSAFWGPLGVLEVVVRNGIHRRLVERCRREDWWNDSRLYLCNAERNAIDSAIETVQRRGNPAPGPNDVVAATTFGLWVGLTGAGWPRDQVHSYETTLWQPRISRAFPHAAPVRRKQIHDELNRLRALRNRIAHHEPIFNAPHAQLRDMILAVTGYVHPDASAYIANHERITEVLASKRATVVDGSPGF